MAAPAETDRRAAPRSAAQHPISLEWQTKKGEFHRARGITRDITHSGVYCFLEHRLPAGVPVEFDLVIPGAVTGANPQKLRCRGRILRSEEAGDQGFGVAISIETSEVLETLAPTADASRQRLYLRVVPPTPIVAEYPGMRSVVRDLSAAGAFIEDERPLPAGRLFHLRLSSERLPTEIEVAAVVRRSEPQMGMAVEFVGLSQQAKHSLRELVGRGSPWRSLAEAFPSRAWQGVEGKPASLDQVKEFLRQRAARALPQVEILDCFYRVGDRLFSLHLRDAASKAELLLPISERWVQECQQDGDSLHIDRALDSAASFFGFIQPTLHKRP
ncbi:MAG: PilZ domain-containing protein [Terriglobia bacterium]